jgi:type I restriction enzyme, S subunit
VGYVGPMVKEYVEHGVPFLRSQDINPFRLDLSSIKYINKAFHAKIKKSSLSPGDVVVVRTGYPGTACVIPPSLPIANCSDVVIIRPSLELDPYFVTALFNSAWGRGSVSNNLVGAAQQHFNVGAAKEMLIDLPPLPVQRRIAAVLSAYDDLIENNQRRIAILEELARSLYREWFVHFRFPGHEGVEIVERDGVRTPEGWEVTSLGKLAYDVRRGINPEDIDPATPYVGLEHLPRRSITLSDWGEAREVQSTKLRFKKGEILFGKIRPYFHKVSVAPIDGVCSSDTIVIVANNTALFPLVLACVSSEAFVEHATQTSQGTKMPRANWDILVKYPVPVPPQDLLSQFQRLIIDIVEQTQNLMFRNRNLRRTRDLLLPRLVSGELDVSELEIVGATEAAAAP